MNLNSDILSMQIRLFRQFMKRHNLDKSNTSKIFKTHDIFGFITDCYDALHISGDVCALNDIDTFLRNSGVSLQ